MSTRRREGIISRLVKMMAGSKSIARTPSSAANRRDARPSRAPRERFSFALVEIENSDGGEKGGDEDQESVAVLGEIEPVEAHGAAIGPWGRIDVEEVFDEGFHGEPRLGENSKRETQNTKPRESAVSDIAALFVLRFEF